MDLSFALKSFYNLLHDFYVGQQMAPSGKIW